MGEDPGRIGGGLVTLVFAAVAFFGGKGVAAIYFPDAAPAPELAVAGTQEQIARGEYLVAIACMGCHSQVGVDGSPSRQHPLSGGWNLSEADGFGFIGDMVTENLTPGGKLASYSDGELFRVLRYSINQQGHTPGVMSFMPYRELSNEVRRLLLPTCVRCRLLRPAGRLATGLIFWVRSC
jgi:hypothetical protein